MFFIVDLKTERVICQFDKVDDLEFCLVNHFDDEHRAKVGIYSGRWVDSWDGPYLVPDLDYLKRSLNQK